MARYYTTNDQLHVGLACDHDFWPSFGVSRFVRGIEYGVVRCRRNHRLTLYGMSANARAELSQLVSLEGVRIRKGSRALCSGYRPVWEQLVLPVLGRLDQVNLLHATAYTAPLPFLTPFVVTIHDVISTTHPELCRTRNVMHHRVMVPLTLRFAKRIITTSTHVAHELSRLFRVDPERVSTIFPGVMPHFFSPISSSTIDNVTRHYGLPEKYLLWVGNGQDPKKNLSALFRAMKVLRGRGCDTLLVLAGASPSRAHQAASAGVRMIGWVQQNHMSALYSGAEAFVFPSLVEGWGLPVSEAMACGVPVVCSSMPAVLETDATAAVLIEPHSEQSIADGLEKLLTDKDLRHTLSLRGRKAVENLTWERHAEALWSQYEDVLAEPHSA